jgi:hypothetical protein
MMWGKKRTNVLIWDHWLEPMETKQVNNWQGIEQMGNHNLQAFRGAGLLGTKISIVPCNILKQHWSQWKKTSQ